MRRPPPRRWGAHEICLLFLGAGTVAALGVCLSPSDPEFFGALAAFFEALAATILFGAFTGYLGHAKSPWLQRLRLSATVAFVVWFYMALGRIAPVLGMPWRDESLLAFDRAFFGATPARLIEPMVSPWLTDVMSLCYLSYHVYLLVVVIHALFKPVDVGWRLATYLGTAFAVGFPGYLLVPAWGPGEHLSTAFSIPLAGGFPFEFCEKFVALGSSVYDVFPSLHILITCVLLDFDWRETRWRFWIMILPAIGLGASTLYLRYHYAIDLVAGFGLFLLLRVWASRQWPRHQATALASA